MVSKKEKNFRNYGKSNKELNALVEKKFQKFVKNKKRRKTEKELQHFQEMQISDDKSKKERLQLGRERGKWRNLSLQF